jgi:hypothetical protein
VVYNTAAIADPAAEPPADIADFRRSTMGRSAGLGADQCLVPGHGHRHARALGEEETRQWLRGIQANEPMSYEVTPRIVEAVGG